MRGCRDAKTAEITPGRTGNARSLSWERLGIEGQRVELTREEVVGAGKPDSAGMLLPKSGRFRLPLLTFSVKMVSVVRTDACSAGSSIMRRTAWGILPERTC